MRIDNVLGDNIGYVENCVPCCTTCNVAKATMGKDDFLSWIERVYNHSIKGSK